MPIEIDFLEDVLKQDYFDLMKILDHAKYVNFAVIVLYLIMLIVSIRKINFSQTWIVTFVGITIQKRESLMNDKISFSIIMPTSFVMINCSGLFMKLDINERVKMV